MPLATEANGWEPSDVIALTAVIVSVAIAIGVQMLSGWLQRRARVEEERNARKREAALCLGNAMGILDQASPLSPTISASRDVLNRHRELRGHWVSVVRPCLLAIAAAYPDARERQLAKRLSAAVDFVFFTTDLFVAELVRSTSQPVTSLDAVRENAIRAFKHAQELAEATATVLRGESLAVSDEPKADPPEGLA